MDTDLDTGKGLISSSSTLPSPRPHRVAPKPLSEELLRQVLAKYKRNGGEKLFNKIIAYRKFGGKHPYCFYSQLIDPEECIDPDDPSSWENINDDLDKDTVSFFFLMTDTNLFSPNQVPLVPGKKIDGTPVFELYYIEIIKLDPLRDFSSIFMRGSNTGHRSMIIYKRSEGEKIPLNQPLRLQNIFRPPSALDSVIIGLSNPASGGWSLWLGRPRFDPENIGPRIDKVKDELTTSEALISYELIKSAAVAELEFTFLSDEELPIEIAIGSICATTNGDPSTERIIQQFPSSDLSSEPSVLQANKPVPVNRSVFGVPLGSRLHLHVNLQFAGAESPGFYPYSDIRRILEFPVPTTTKSVEKYIPLIQSYSNPKLRVKVSWWDFMV
ncbi:hypothetical protein FRX31_020192 [Thalictrum thalictroides]|uniref:Uncharacterized protein n=1 Tax=Thalictrum thalictroides TaxID=46969 RepID=A0A7J6VZE1_THATH|nr:hypothetical protein FRX31_020192 [Thalictrum thalictroides]